MLKSKQTGFIHYNYHSKDGEHHTIPSIENACHILELFRSRQADQLYEAKFLLNKLLQFQAPSGNFPIYLHDYPECYDPSVGFYMLAPLFYILKEFKTIAGSNLQNNFDRLIKYCKTCKDAKEEHLAILDAALNRPVKPFDSAHASRWGDYLIAYSMQESKLSLTPLAKRWDHKNQHFLGLREHQLQKQVQPTLLDSFLTNASHPRQSLTKAIELVAPNSSSLIYTPNHTPQVSSKTFHLMRWDHLVCQTSQHHAICSGELDIDFTYTEKLPVRDEDHMELKFFYPHDGAKQKATTFQLNELVSVGPFTICFKVLEGEGKFYGHIARVNRPAQKDLSKAYDWQIGLRTVKRKEHLKLRVEIRQDF